MDAALELAKLINSDDFQRKLQEFVARKDAAEAAEARAQKVIDQSAQVKGAIEALKTKVNGELAEAKKAHDKAADEAALRLRLADSVKKELDLRKANLDDREHRLTERETAVQSAHSHFDGALRSLGLTKP